MGTQHSKTRQPMMPRRATAMASAGGSLSIAAKAAANWGMRRNRMALCGRNGAGGAGDERSRLHRRLVEIR